MKKNIWVKVFAILALFGILIWIVWTWILFLFESGNSYETQTAELTPEQIEQLLEQQEATASGGLEDNSVIEVVWVTQDGEQVEALTQ